MMESVRVPPISLQAFVIKRDFSSVVALLNQSPNLLIDITLIKKLLATSDIAMILTLYCHSETVKTLIDKISLSNQNDPFVKKIKIYLAQVLTIDPDENTPWIDILQKILTKWDDWEGDQPLHRAIRNSEQNSIDELLRTGADIYAKNKRGITPLHLAAQYPTITVLTSIVQLTLDSHNKKLNWFTQLIYGRRIDATVEDNEGETPAHTAAGNTNSEILKLMIKSTHGFRISVNKQNKCGLTPLHYATIINSSENVKILLERQADSSIGAYSRKLKDIIPELEKLNNSITPLILALELMHWDVIPELVKDYADLALTKNSKGMSPVHFAALMGKDQLLTEWRNFNRFKKWIGALSSENPLKSHLDNEQRTPLHYAVIGNSVAALKVLLQDYAISLRDKHGNLPLHFAAMHSAVDVTKYIIELYNDQCGYQKNANWLKNIILNFTPLIEINVRNKTALTAYMIASELQNSEIMALLSGAGCDRSPPLQYVLKAISEQGKQRGPATEQEQNLIQITNAIPSLFEIPNSPINLIHYCAMNLNYRMALILLHACNQTKRKSLCSSISPEGKSPLALLKEAYETLPNNDIKERLTEQFQKFKRLLLKYDTVGYQSEITTTIAAANYRFQLVQDKRNELMDSNGYWYASRAMLYGAPIFEFGKTFLIAESGGVILGAEAAARAYFGSDYLDKLDRTLQDIKPYAGERLQRPITWTQNALWTIGMYRHTVMRVSVEVVRQAVAYSLSYMDNSDLGSFSNNYFTSINALGALYYAAEEYGGRQLLAPIVSELAPNLEELAVDNLGVPTITELIDTAMVYVGETAKSYIGVNPFKWTAESYNKFREACGVKPAIVLLREYFKEKVLPEIEKNLVETDANTRELLIKGAEVIFINDFDSSDTLNNNLNEWIYFGNNGFKDDSNYELINWVANELAKGGSNYAEVMSAFILQPHLINNYGMNIAIYEQMESALISMLNGDWSSQYSNQADYLEHVANSFKSRLENHYISTRKSGTESSNDYRNQLDISFGKKQAAKIVSQDGRAEYMAWLLVSNHPLFFGGMTPAQLSDYVNYFRRILYNAQALSEDKDNVAAAECFDQLNTFFACKILNPYFSSGNILIDSTRSVLEGTDPVAARAAFAVHQTQSLLNSGEGYNPLRIEEEIALYFNLINAHYLKNAGQTEEKIHDLTFDAIQSHAIDKGNYQFVAGKFTIDEAANHIFVTSLNAAEFRWAGSTESEVRKVPVKHVSTLKRIGKALLASSSGEIGVGASTAGAAPKVGLYNFSAGRVTPVSVSLGVPSVGKYQLTLPEKIPSSVSNSTNFDMSSIFFQFANVNAPLSPLDIWWNDELDRAVAELVRFPNEQDYYQAALLAPSVNTTNTSCSGIVDCTLQFAEQQYNNFVSTVSDIQALAQLPVEEPSLAQSAASTSEPSRASEYKPSFWIKSAHAGASMAITPVAPAITPTPVPVIITDGTVDKIRNFFSLVVASVSPAAFNMIFPKVDDNKLEFPIHENEGGDYRGSDLDELLSSPTTLITPANPVQGVTKLETPMDQPGDKMMGTTFPITTMPALVMYQFAKSKDDQPFVSKVEAPKQRVYDSDYPKHKPNSKGTGSNWGKKASINPIPNNQIGQSLLDNAFYDPSRPKQLVNYYDDTVIKFRTSNDGRWHAYAVTKQIVREVGNDALEHFLNNGLISEKEYRQLVKL